jgi:phosphatidylglycerophosphatase A
VRRPVVLLATGFGIGFLPVAPATWASLATILVLFAIPGSLAPTELGIAILLLLPVSVWASGEAERDLGRDAHPIVIDEVVGMLISVWGIAYAHRLVVVLVLGFVLFRVFDVLKPFGIRKSQDLPGGWGVVADDVLAGIATNLVLRFALGFLP